MGEQAWPPEPREAEALANALCEVFGAGYFEPFLALIQAKSSQDCERFLRRAGASLDIDEKRTLFLGRDADTDAAQSTWTFRPNLGQRSGSASKNSPLYSLVPEPSNLPRSMLGDHPSFLRPAC